MIGNVIQKMIAYFGTDVLRISHALKVYGYAKCIAQGERLLAKDLLVVDLAAILHDIGIVEAQKKYNKSSGHYQEIEGPPVAMALLSDMGLDKACLDRVAFLIGHHHSYSEIDGSDFQILVEADFLVNIDEDKMSIHSIESIREKYFKTKTGISIIEGMYDLV